MPDESPGRRSDRRRHKRQARGRASGYGRIRMTDGQRAGPGT